MKKYILSTSLVLIVLVSCGKTTKGKVVNDWKVDSYTEVYVIADNMTGNSTTTTLNLNGSVYDELQVSSTNYIIHHTGTVPSNTFTFKKDGTWESQSEYLYVNTSNINTQFKTIKKASGTWSFVRKTKGDDFKRNERILCNTLYAYESTTTFNLSTGENGTYNQFTEDTYLTGEKVLFYTVTESKGDKLVLETKSAKDLKDESGTMTYSRTRKMTLTAK